LPIVRAAPDALLELASEPTGKVIVGGERNVLRIGADVRFEAGMEILGRDCEVVIGPGCHILGSIRIQPEVTGRLRIGAGTTATGVAIAMHEDGEILIGADCMLSMDLYLEVSDVHPLFDGPSGRRINPPRPIRIGDHVWIGRRALIMKGAEIGDGAVIGSGSVVRGRVPPRAIAAGAPAKVLRRDIEWRRSLKAAIPPIPRPRRGWRFWRRRPDSFADLPHRPNGARMSLDQLGPVAAPFDQPGVRLDGGAAVVVDGFAYDATGQLARAVEVVLDGRSYPARYGEHRPDVAEGVGDPALGPCGFRALLPPDALSPGPHGLAIRVVLADGRAQDLTGVLPFEVG
jgi:acetyltransferase-like isoleucine patch superfamily enzyme